MSMWEPFTERARRSIVLAQEEAQRLGNNYIGTEHILLGIISEGESLAAKVLETLGVNLAKVRQEVEAMSAAAVKPSSRRWSLPHGPNASSSWLSKRHGSSTTTISGPSTCSSG